MGHSHIHEVMLIPCWAVEGKIQCSGSNLTNGLADFSHCAAAEGEICRNFNCPKWFHKATCQFTHICSCCVGSQACGKAHAGRSRFVSISQGQWLANISSPLNTSLWVEKLADDPEEDFLLDGLTSGFELFSNNATLQCAETNNYSSVTNAVAEAKTEAIVKEEIPAGNYFVTPQEPTI